MRCVVKCHTTSEGREVVLNETPAHLGPASVPFTHTLTCVCVCVCVCVPRAVMENSTEEQREVGGANGELSPEEAGLTENTHNNLKGT